MPQDIRPANQLTAEEYALRAGVPVSQVQGTFGNFTIAPASSASPNVLATPYTAPITLPSGPVPVDKLTEPVVPKAGETPAPTDFNAILKGVMASLPAPVDTTQNDLIMSKINELSGSTDMTQNYMDLSNQYGVTDKQKIVSDLTAQLNSMNAESMQKQENALNQPGVISSIGTAQAGYEERTRAIKALALSAQIQVAQGNLTFAQDQVDKMVDLKYQASKDQISAWTQAYNLNRNSLSAQEKRIGDAQSQAMTIYMNQVSQQQDQEKQVKTTLLNWMSNYPSAGISLNDTFNSAQQKILNSPQYKNEQLKLQPTPTPTDNNGNPVLDTTLPTLNGKPRTDTQNTALGYAQRMQDSDSVISELGSQFTGWASYVGQRIPNVMKGADRQKFEQAQRNFINAVLRKESGAAISPSEFDSAAKQYFPQPGDSAGVLAQKSANRQRVISSFLQASNTAVGNVQTGGSYEDYLNAVK